MLSHPKNKLFLFLLCFSIAGCAGSSYGSYGSSRIKNSKSMHRATMKPYTVNGKRYYPTMVSVGDHFSGIASWYGPGFHGKKTSNGEIYNKYSLTAAHKTLPMNTMVKVTNLLNNRSQVVRINDRGPFVKGRIIDLSYTAAHKLGVAKRGTAPVRLEVVGFRGHVDRHSSSSGGSQGSLGWSKKSVRMGNLLIQLGAFRKLDGAKSYGRELKRKYGKNYKVYIKRSIWKGSYIYRLYLRGFKSEEEARDFIESGHFGGSFIVRDE